LSEIVIEKLKENGVDAVRISPHEIIEAKEERIVNIDKREFWMF